MSRKSKQLSWRKKGMRAAFGRKLHFEPLESRQLLDAAPLPLPTANIPALPQLQPTVITAGGQRLLLNYFNNAYNAAHNPAAEVQVSFDASTDTLVCNKPGWYVENFPLAQINGLQTLPGYSADPADTVAKFIFGSNETAADVENWYIMTPVDSTHPAPAEPAAPTGPAPITPTSLTATVGGSHYHILVVDNGASSNTLSTSDTWVGSEVGQAQSAGAVVDQYVYTTITAAVNALTSSAYFNNTTKTVTQPTIILITPGVGSYEECVNAYNINGASSTDPLILEGVPDANGNMPVWNTATSFANGWTPVAGASNVWESKLNSNTWFGGLVVEHTNSDVDGDLTPGNGNQQTLIDRTLPSNLQQGEVTYQFASDEFENNLHGMASQTTAAQMPDQNLPSNAVWTPDSDIAGLAGYWKFDDASGTTAADSSGNGNTGTLVNSPKWIAGNTGDAVQLNGSSQYVDVPSSSNFDFGQGAFTLSAWVNLSSAVPVGQTYSILERGMTNSSTPGFSLALSNTGGGTNVVFSIGAGGSLVTLQTPGSFNPLNSTYYSEINVCDGGWHQITATRDASGNGRIYIDGLLRTTAANMTASVSPGSSKDLFIGQNGSGANYFTGGLDDVRIYNKATDAGYLDFGSSGAGAAANKVYWASSWVWVPAGTSTWNWQDPETLTQPVNNFTYGPFRICQPNGGNVNNQFNTDRIWVNGQLIPAAIFATGTDNESLEPHSYQWPGDYIDYGSATATDEIDYLNLQQGWNHLVFQFDTSETANSSNDLHNQELAFKFGLNSGFDNNGAGLISQATAPVDLSQAPTTGTPEPYISQYSVLSTSPTSIATPFTNETLDPAVYVRLRNNEAPVNASMGIANTTNGPLSTGAFTQVRGLDFLGTGIGIGRQGDLMEGCILQSFYGGWFNESYPVGGSVQSGHGSIGYGSDANALDFYSMGWTNNVMVEPDCQISNGTPMDFSSSSPLPSGVNNSNYPERLNGGTYYSQVFYLGLTGTNGVYDVYTDPSCQSQYQVAISTGWGNTSINIDVGLSATSMAPMTYLNNWIVNNPHDGSCTTGATPDLLTQSSEDGNGAGNIPFGRLQTIVEYNMFLNSDTAGAPRWWDDGGTKSFFNYGSVFCYNVYDGGADQALWYDTENLENRVEGNIFENFPGGLVDFEASSGPNLVANNICCGLPGIFNNCSNQTWAVNNTIDTQSQSLNLTGISLDACETCNRGNLWETASPSQDDMFGGYANDPADAYVNNVVLGCQTAITADLPNGHNLEPDSVVCGDFNGDGKLDLAVANNESNTVSILLGNGDGTFQNAVSYNVGTNPDSIVAGDFNGDGKLDLAVTNYGSNSVSILLNTGNGTFQNAITYSVGTNPDSIVAGDFNGDGKTDLAVANYTDGTVSILLNTGSGTSPFPSSPSETCTVGTNPDSIVASDFNGDGKLDLAAANYTDGTVSILLNNGNTSFFSAVSYSLGKDSKGHNDKNPKSIAVGDFDGDGKLDLAAANYNDGTVTILLGNGNGTFASSPSAILNVGADPIAVAAGHFTSDGKLDLVIANYWDWGFNWVTVLLNNGSGPGNISFQAATQYPTGTSPCSVITGNLNSGDNYLDLATTNYSSGTVSILLGNGDGTFQKKVDFGTYPLQPDTVADNYTDNPTDTYLANENGAQTQYPGGVKLISSGNLGFENEAADNYQLTADSPLNTAGTNTADFSNGSTITNYNVMSLVTQDFYGLPRDIQGEPQSAGATRAGMTFASTDIEWENAAGNQYRLTALNPPNGQWPSNVSPIVTVKATTSTASDSPLSDGTFTVTRKGSTAAALTVNYTLGGTAHNGTDYTTLTGSVQIPINSATATITVAPLDDGVPTGAETVVLTLSSCPSSYILGGQSTDTVTIAAHDQATVNLSISGSSTLTEGGSPGAFTVTRSGDTSQPLVVDYAMSGTAVNGADYNFDYTTSTPTAQWKMDETSGTTVSDSSINGLNGTFQTAPPYSMGGDYGPCGVVSADFNGDGRLDLATANYDASSVSIFLGNGDGTFQSPLTYQAGPEPVALAVGNFGNGHLDLAVVDSGSNTVAVLLGNGNGTFNNAVYYTVGSGPNGVVAGDFNHDGKLDLATANTDDDTVSVLLGNGNGTFQTQTTYSVGSYPIAIASGDFNHDGNLDLVAANSGGYTVSLLLGNSNGSFQTAIPYNVGSSPYGVVVGDFNGDGNLDLATANSGDNTVSVLLGNSNGAFQTQTVYNVGSCPVSIVAGDFNNDGNLDLATANYCDSTASVLLGNGAGKFQTKTDYTTGAGPWTITAADIYGQGNLDLVTGDYDSSTLSIIGVQPWTSGHLNGALSLNSANSQCVSVPSNSDFSFGTGAFTLSAWVKPLNFNAAGDNYTIMARGQNTSNYFEFGLSYGANNGIFLTVGNSSTTMTLKPTADQSSLLGNGSWHLVTVTRDASGNGTLYIDGVSVGTLINMSSINVSPGDSRNLCLGACLDQGSNYKYFNGSLDDVRVYNNALTAPDIYNLFYNLVWAPGTVTIPAGQSSATINILPIEDLVADGSETATLTISTDPDNIYVRGGTYSQTMTINDTTNESGLVANWKLDETSGANASDSSSNGLSGTLNTSPAAYSTGSNTGPNAVVAADFNGDGKMDLATANVFNNTVSVFMGNGDGTFQPAVNYNTGGSGSCSIVAADFNRDGKMDLAVTNAYSNTVSIFLGNGDGTFHSAVTYSTGSEPNAIVAADFNGDGKIDLAIANYGDNTISILLGNGDGTFPQTPSNTYSTGTGPTSIAAGDFDANGTMDLVTANYNANTVSVFLGNGDGTFTAHNDIATGVGPITVAVADLNHDGKLDLAVADATANSYSVLLGNDDGTFAAHTDYPAGSDPVAIAAVDLNGDGIPDLVTTNCFDDTALVHLNNGDGTFPQSPNFTYTTGSWPETVIPANIYGQGDTDLVTSNCGDNTVTVLSCPKWSAGHLDGALTFHPANSEYISVPSNSDFNFGTGAFTLSAWVKPLNFNAAGDNYTIMARGQNTSNYFEFGLSYGANNGIFLTVGNSSTTMTLKPTADQSSLLGNGSWHLVTVTRDASGNGTLYIDGVSVGTLINMSSINVSPGDSQNLGIGACLDQGSNYKYFNGSLDDVRVYNTSLSAGEVGILAGIENGVSIVATDPVAGIEDNTPNNAVTISNWNNMASSWGGVTAGDASGQGQFTLTRTGDLSQPLTVYYNVTGTASTNGAVYQLIDAQGNVYTGASGQATFLAGQNTTTVTVQPLLSSLSNNSLSVILQLISDSQYEAASQASADSTATVSIAGNDIVGDWPLNGNANDTSGNGLNGTPENSPSFPTSGGVTLNGTNQFIQVPSNSSSTVKLGTNPFTLSAWIKLGDSITSLGTGTYGIISNGFSRNGGYNRFDLDVFGTGTGMWMGIGGDLSGNIPNLQMVPSADVRGALLNHQWHLVTTTRDNFGAVRFYFDGVLVGICLNAGFSVTDINPNSKITIGLADWGNNYFNGSLADVCIYGRVLEPGEIEKMATLVAPTGLTAAAASANQINLSWTATPCTEVDGYNIYRGTSPGGEGATPINGNTLVTGATYCDTTASAGTAYYYFVEAVNGAGSSVASSEAETPMAPTGLGATQFSTTQINLSWTPSSSPVTGYNIYRSTASGGENYNNTPLNGSTPWTSTSYNDISCPSDGATYYYTVEAVSGTGSSLPSNEASATTPLAAPTGLTATDDGTHPTSQIDLGWVDNSSAESGYQIWRAPDVSGSPGTFTQVGTTVANATTYSDTSVTDGTKYWYEVRAYNTAAGASLYSNQQNATTALTIPTGLTGTGVSTTQISLSWNGVGGPVTGYKVYRGTTSGGENTLVYNNSGANFTDTVPTAGNIYYYIVETVNGSMTSAPSTEAAVPTIPNAPSGLTATAVTGATQIALTWTASTGNAVSSYNIYRGPSAGNEGTTAINTSPVTATTYTDTSCSGSTTYYYIVKAVNTAGGLSGATNEVNKMTVPAAPTGATATSIYDNTNLSVHWTAASGATSYYVYRGTSSSGENYSTAVYSGAGTSFTDTTTIGNTRYYYTVKAVNASGNSGISAETSALTWPAAPSNLTAADDTTNPATTIDLSWTASSGGATGTISYMIFRSTTSGSFNWPPLGGSTTNTYCSDATCSPGATYYYEVEAINQTPNYSVGSTSNQAGAVTAPTGLTATASACEITLNWTAASGPVTSYNLYRGTSSGGENYSTAIYSGTSTSFRDAGLTAGTTYYYTVKLVNGSYTSSHSTEASATPTAALSLPTNLVAYWRLDEKTGVTAYDTATGGSTADTGTFESKYSPTWTTGKIGNALTFVSANTQYVNVPYSTDLNITSNTITIACWAEAASTTWNSANPTFVSRENDYMFGPYGSYGVQVQLYIGSSFYQAYYNPTSAPSGGLNSWHHYAAVYNGSLGSGNIQLYVDGSAVTTTNTNETGNLVGSTSYALSIGCDYAGTLHYLNGSLDEVRLYNSALPSSAISALYGQAALSVTSNSHGTVKNFALTTSLNSSPVSQYSDQSYTFTSSATMNQFIGSTFIQTADADRLSTGSQLLSFTTNTPCIAYVLYDTDITGTNKATWLSGCGFTDTGSSVTSSHTGHTFEVYKLVMSSGTLWLGGNTALGTDQNQDMYTVILQPLCLNGTTIV